MRTFKTKTLVFCGSKRKAHRIRLIFGFAGWCALCRIESSWNILHDVGLRVSELHGNLSQTQRLEAIQSFQNVRLKFASRIAIDIFIVRALWISLFARILLGAGSISPPCESSLILIWFDFLQCFKWCCPSLYSFPHLVLLVIHVAAETEGVRPSRWADCTRGSERSCGIFRWWVWSTDYETDNKSHSNGRLPVADH